jgi:hypothetical protein
MIQIGNFQGKRFGGCDCGQRCEQRKNADDLSWLEKRSHGRLLWIEEKSVDFSIEQ